MSEKKINNFQSPDLNKLQSVVVDSKTTIFIRLGADKEKAKNLYLDHINSMNFNKK